MLSPVMTLLLLTALSGLLATCHAQVGLISYNYSVQYQEPVNLTCSVELTSGPVSLSMVRADGSPLETIDSIGPSSQSITHSITSVQLSDAGQYTCTATLSNGTDVASSSSTFYVDITSDTCVSLTQSLRTVSARLGETVCFTCLSEESRVEWYKDEQLLQFSNRIIPLNQLGSSLAILNTTYANIGSYTCAEVVNRTSVVEEASLDFTITGYVAPYVRVTAGFGLIKSSEQRFVECTFFGVPGPSLIYWERLDEDMNRTRVATNSSSSGPVVDSQGRLDLLPATEEDSGFYVCIGEDVTGASASQRFRIEITPQEEFVLWVQWYMILAYCFVVLVILVLILVGIWFCYATQASWWVPVAKRVKIKRRMKVKKPVPLPIDDFIREVHGKK